MLNSAPDILGVLDILQKHGPAHLTRWFEQGLQEYLADGDKTLDICFGMRGQSERSWLYQFRMIQRNNYLTQAHSLCDGESPWKKACMLEEQISKFQGIIWPRFRNLESVPPDTSSLRTALFNAATPVLPC